MINESIIDLDKTKYPGIKKRATKLLSIYLSLMVFVLALGAYKIHKLHTLKTEIKDTQNKIHVASQRLNKAIMENNAINKTLFTIHNIKLEHDSSFKFYLNHIKELISSFAHYYEVSAPVIADFSFPKNAQEHNITNIDIDMFISAASDEAIITFIDALITNLKGFVRIQEMEMVKNKKEDIADGEIKTDTISCTLKLSWHVLLEKADSKPPSNRRISVFPHKPKIAVEDVCRLSVWEGSLMLPAEIVK